MLLYLETVLLKVFWRPQKINYREQQPRSKVTILVTSLPFMHDVVLLLECDALQFYSFIPGEGENLP